MLVSVLLASVLLAVLAAASADTELLARHYPLLLRVNLGMAVALAVLVLELTRRLIKRYRRGLFGSRLMARLAWSFTLMTVIPGLLIYLVSVQFVGRAIESWFAVPVENALRSGLSFAQASLDALLQDLVFKARRIDLELSAVPTGQLQP
ncbi:MAG: PAS domain-containing sensor histidine kinase, partial [Burkholderiales bacterium]